MIGTRVFRVTFSHFPNLRARDREILARTSFPSATSKTLDPSQDMLTRLVMVISNPSEGSSMATSRRLRNSSLLASLIMMIGPGSKTSNVLKDNSRLVRSLNLHLEVQ